MSAASMPRSLKNRYRAAIIGAGPAGLAAASGLLRAGIGDFIVIEREAETGGILNQCIHNGFGLKYYRQDLTGPEFARRMETELNREIRDSGAGQPHILTSVTVSDVRELPGSGFRLNLKSRRFGIRQVEADTVIAATGCRERTRENIEIPGTRPAGIFTAGQAQNLINRRHYAIGNRIVIQGSGDIGLIMARRLTLEGFEVAAVFERLPWLSGSIRNKVQCLDHFGIPLCLGRQIAEIKGHNRVSSVITHAMDSRFNPLPDTETEIACDTVLFAAGLIPELETVKPAGVTLSDRFHPDVNYMFETGAAGLFAAGNCLHINDLADSAAGEGAAAAASAAAFLESEKSFRIKAASSADKKPYSQPKPQTELTEAYFRRIKEENLTVCIVCPRGCLLSEGNFGCIRGEEYFRRTATPAGELRQRLHTTIIMKNGLTGLTEIIPVVSEEEIPVGIFREVITAVKKAAAGLKHEEQTLQIKAGGMILRFNLCRQESPA